MFEGPHKRRGRIVVEILLTKGLESSLVDTLWWKADGRRSPKGVIPAVDTVGGVCCCIRFVPINAPPNSKPATLPQEFLATVPVSDVVASQAQGVRRRVDALQ